jgi:multicomponent K+:H+ antiporter subunit C
MELLVATAIGALTAAGIYMILRLRTFPVIIGTSLLSYAVNVFLFASGRLSVNAPPVLRDGLDVYADPLPQALVLTAIVISFGMTAVAVMVALGSYLSADDDMVNDPETHPSGAEPAEPAKRGRGAA